MVLADHIIVKRSKRARRMALRLDPHTRVFNLVVPKGVSLKRAESFAKDHEFWMQERLSELAPRVPFEHGSYLPLLGREVKIEIEKSRLFKTTSINLEDGRLCVRTNLNDPATKIKKFLKDLGKRKISELAHAKASQINKTINKIYCRDTKSRWGSCSEDNNLNFSWRLIFAPSVALDYVIAHEVAHLQHLDHSKAFWSLCRELSEDFIEGQYWMQAHGQDLMRYG